MHRASPVVSAIFGLACLMAMPISSTFAAGASRPIPLAGGGSWCLPANSSCDDGPWWQAQSERTSGRRREASATYAGLDGLTSDPDFAEAVRLLWEWPEGRKELVGAANRGTQIVQGPRHPSADTDSFATYDVDTGTVEVAYDDMDVPTWMLADLLAHELRHANDTAQPGLWSGSTSCYTLEVRAYLTEQRYMGWLVDNFGSLPSESAEADADLSSAADELYANMINKVATTDVESLVHDDYADTC